MPKNSKKIGKKISVSDIVLRAKPVELKRREGADESGALKVPVPVKKSSRVKEPPEKEAVLSVAPLNREELAPIMEAAVYPAEEGTGRESPPQDIPRETPERKVEEQVQEFEKREVERFREEERAGRRKKITLKTYLLVVLLFIVLGGTAYGAFTYLPWAKIRIITKKAEWHWADAITATKKAATADAENKLIPAEIFSGRNNFTFTFPATGKKTVERKAKGKITIYNAYSSAAQALVQNTRFSDPSGKIFRLEKSVVVPGAQIVEGKITPSSIEIAVVADKPGVDYNIGPTGRFKIPGFVGSPRYDGFYGESKEPMTGGLIGEAAFPTEADIKKSYDQAVKSMKENVDSRLYLGVPSDFKVIDGSEQFSVLKEEIGKEANQDGNFTIFLDVQSSVIAFRESDVLTLVKELANNDLKKQNVSGSGNFEIKSYKVDYGSGRMDLGQGQISFTVNFEGVLWQPINARDFEKKALTKSEADLKPLVDSLASVEKVTISFWPFWVNRVPENPERVEIEVQ